MIVHTKITLAIEGDFRDIINLNWLMVNNLLSNNEFATTSIKNANGDVLIIEVSQSFCIIVKTNCTLIQIYKVSFKERLLRLFRDILSCLTADISSVYCGVVVENFSPCDVQRFKDSVDFPFRDDYGSCYAIKIRLDNPLIRGGESFEKIEIVYVVKDGDESTRSEALKFESFTRVFCPSLESISQYSKNIRNYIEKAEEVNNRYIKQFVNEE